MTIRNSRISVKDHGAVGDGISDDSSAFTSAVSRIMSLRTKDLANHGGHYRYSYTLYIPAGVYKITQAEVLLPRTFAPEGGNTIYTFGLTIEGDGRYATQIVYAPTSTGTYLMYDNDLLLSTTIRGITFTCTAAGNTEGFLYSRASIAQNTIFEHCSWDGNWKYGMFLSGGNLNSEKSWFHCNVSGSWDSFFYIPPSDVSGRPPTDGVYGSDQFVNYNFFSCNFEVSRGNYIKTLAGGSINIWGGSMKYSDAANTFPSTFFTLGHIVYGGAARFLCTGARFEIAPNVNNQMIFCEYMFGTVKFTSCDNAKKSDVAGTDYVNAVFDFGSEQGANVTFDGCVLMGKHEYRYGSSGYQRQQRATYRNCEMWHHENADTFLVMNKTGTTNGSHPLIRFEGCRGANKGIDQYKYLFDCTHGWHLNNRARSDKKILRVSTANNTFPRSNSPEEVYLPMNSLITNITMFVAAGATGSATTGWHFLVKTSETTPTTLADIIPVNNNPSSGINTSTNILPAFNANSDTKRHLVISGSTQVDSDVSGYIVIEYIA